MKGRLTTRRLSLAAISAALVCVATMVVSVYVPATNGYFNVGEVAVYSTALLFGPVIGAFAGGVGSMLADLLLGYPVYAPATFVIKGIEGALVGYLSSKYPSLKKSNWKFFTISTGIVIGLLVGWLGIYYYSGEIELSVGLPTLGYNIIILALPALLWIFVAGLSFLFLAVSGMVYDSRLGWKALSVAIGGIEMVLGYFLYEWAIYGSASIAELPINIGQFTIGLIVSIPLSEAVSRKIPFLRKKITT
jgi:uncharacterized membrane protein